MSGNDQRCFWPLMALACAPEGVLSPVQLQKTLFLVAERAGGHIGQENLYKFVAHNYGPFSVEIYQDIDALAQEDKVNVAPGRLQRWKSYKLTENGRVEAEKALAELAPEVKDFLEDVVDWVVKRDFPDLLRAIYNEYPQYAVNSVFRERS